MNENKQEREMEIDIQRLVGAVWKRLWLVVLAAILGAVIAFMGTVFMVTPLYQSSALFYVNNSALSVGDASVSISSGDLSVSRNLVNSYIVILKTRASLNDVIDYAGVNRTYEELRGMISAASVSNTEIFEVVVTSPDPQEAEKIANAIAYILPKRISSIIEGTSAKVVDAAVVPRYPSSPNYTSNTMTGILIGLVLSIGIIILREIFDVTIRTEEDISRCCKHPVLASVPDMAAPSKGGYYGYGSKKDGQKSTAAHGKQPVLIGKDINFAAAEAYKLLRTKLQFSFADENDCHIIGVSSALTGEGKSLSSVNLAYTLSQLDKKVLLVDCDMRRPSINTKLPVQKMPGLSNYLSGQSHLDTLVQQCGIPEEEDAFDVVAAGRNPPNPIELLSSARMDRLLGRLRGNYDYIILDLPPVGEVSDAMAVAKHTDGILLVVRQNYCNRAVLGDAVRQFAFIDTKILGVVYNCASESGTGYGKGSYKKYYKKYEGSYMSAAKSAKKAAARPKNNQE